MSFSDPEFITLLTTSCASCAAAIVSVIKAVSASRMASRASRMLDDAKKRQTYLVCPHCSKKVYLSEIDFHLPSGSLDNNFNGLPDDRE